jgi:hypothetical protein
MRPRRRSRAHPGALVRVEREGDFTRVTMDVPERRNALSVHKRVSGAAAVSTALAVARPSTRERPHACVACRALRQWALTRSANIAPAERTALARRRTAPVVSTAHESTSVLAHSPLVGPTSWLPVVHELDRRGAPPWFCRCSALPGSPNLSGVMWSRASPARIRRPRRRVGRRRGRPPAGPRTARGSARPRARRA